MVPLMDKCDFLIVTPVLNGSRFIADCILSVKEAFVHHSFIHVIIDGGSTDNTEEVIKKNHHDSLVYLSIPGSSMYEAINEGIDFSEASFFYQLNADDLILPETPDYIYNCFKQDAAVDIISGAILSVDIEENSCKLKVPLIKQFTIKRIGVNLFVNQPSTFVRYSILKEIGGFSENYRYASDTELWLHLIRKGYHFERTAKCLSINRVHSVCAALSDRHAQELKTVRELYYSATVFLPLAKLFNSVLFLFTQVLAMSRINMYLPHHSKSFGGLLSRIYGVFFSTRRAGVVFSYPFFKGIFWFEGRFR